jgi:hypothetical protein
MALSAAVRGAVNTPEAVKEKWNGKEWDPKTRKWVAKATNASVEDSPVFAEARGRKIANGNGASSSKSAAATKCGVKPTNALVEDSPEFAEARRRHHANGNGNGSSSSKSATAFPHYYAVLGIEVCAQGCLLLRSALCGKRQVQTKACARHSHLLHAIVLLDL